MDKEKLEQTYTLSCNICGEPYYSQEAFPSEQLCPACRELELTVSNKLAEFFKDPIDIPCPYCEAARRNEMLTIENIETKDILEMVTYQQHTYNHCAVIKIMRGYKFYARCVANVLQEWITDDTPEQLQARYLEAIRFESGLGSRKL